MRSGQLHRLGTLPSLRSFYTGAVACRAKGYASGSNTRSAAASGSAGEPYGRQPQRSLARSAASRSPCVITAACPVSGNPRSRRARLSFYRAVAGQGRHKRDSALSARWQKPAAGSTAVQQSARSSPENHRRSHPCGDRDLYTVSKHHSVAAQSRTGRADLLAGQISQVLI